MSALVGSHSSNSSESGRTADEVLRAIRRILRKTAEYSRQLSREGDLTVPQLLCLRRVAQAGDDAPVTVAGVARDVQLSNATASRILDRLEQSGLVARQRGTGDRRKVYLTLTDEGKRRVGRLRAPLHEEFLTRFRQLDAGEQQALLQGLQRIVELMGAADLDAAPMLTPDADMRRDS